MALFEDGAVTQRRSSLPDTVKERQKERVFFSRQTATPPAPTHWEWQHMVRPKKCQAWKKRGSHFLRLWERKNLIWTFPCVYNRSWGTGTDECSHIHAAITFSRWGEDGTSPKQPSASAKRTSGIMSFDSRVVGEAGCCQETHRWRTRGGPENTSRHTLALASERDEWIECSLKLEAQTAGPQIQWRIRLERVMWGFTGQRIQT